MLSIAVACLVAAVLPELPPDMGFAEWLSVSALWGFFTFGWYGPWVAHVAELSKKDAIGLTLGLAMTGNQLGIVAAPPAFGQILDVSGSYAVAWWSLAAALLAGAGLGVRELRRR
jgi:predicted MFS family arabinose efflux permease